MKRLALVEQHVERLRACRACPDMQAPVVTGTPVLSDVLLIGQAPGVKEPQLGRPFAWTAGKRLFGWFGDIGVDEATFRARVYMAAVCRCFPGKSAAGGDRVPSAVEITNCRPWLERELELLRPSLLLPVGRLAIEQVLPPAPLSELIGRRFEHTRDGRRVDVIPLPHPSGASTWFHVEPGRTLLRRALALIDAHPTWARLKRAAAEPPPSPGAAARPPSAAPARRARRR
jgi:uracil-DNA glycosylase